MTDVEVPGAKFVPLATFEGFMKRWTGNARDDHLELTFGVEAAAKYDAMPVTDRPGRKLRVVVEMATFEGEPEYDADE